MTLKAISSNSDSFSKYLDSCKGEVKNRSSENYYPTNVVADAFNEGFKAGKESGEKTFLNRLVADEIEKFTQKAQQIYILSKTLINLIEEKGYQASGLYINLSFQRPNVIVSIPNKYLNNDDFVKMAYSKIHENQNIYSKLFNETLDMGLVESDNLDESLLKEDGFGYSENY